MTPVNLNDFQRQWRDVSEESQAVFASVGASGWYILGREVEAFEASLSSYSSIPHVVGCANGLDAIELSLRALDLKPGEQVLTTPLSAFPTTLAILRAGGTPVYVDVDEHGLLDLELAREAFEQDQTLRVMVPVHLFGKSLDLARLNQLKQTFGLRIVEDMAQAVGASSNGRPVATVGQLSAVSFYPTKNLGCFGDGGAVLTTDPNLADRCRCLRDYGQETKYRHVELGLNSRLDEVQAALLNRVFLPRLEGWTQRRREIAVRYCREIAHPAVSLPEESHESVWHLYAVRVRLRREDLMRHLSGAGVQTGIHYPTLIPDQPCMAGSDASLPRARQWAAEVLSVPIHPYLRDDEVSHVVDAINSWRGYE